MEEIVVDGISYELDKDGFLDETSDWNENIAIALAKKEGVGELTEEHWKVIRYLRSYYDEFGISPIPRKFYKETGYSKKSIIELFPAGLQNGAFKISGLANPTGCI
ncbi:TusE/DsrC/DsvC family sulfur relay protein [Desulfitobacterium sp.]|uniref:TusE/DsrC/DsvC family sulfur relay protein n=1 Tax=Desulfitobacterium sp. TaxID=49981 RepID=UPI002B1E9FD8|nr:TusE/DsrC/DsvC family sulfur relay protein [Desulfitobacterium sp.]MEA4903039.1 TusE/DsrC/DsvC family sulfur relay protein [Desulfitobacterium sp.]